MKSTPIPFAILALLALGLVLGACQSPADEASLAEDATVTTAADAVAFDKAATVQPGGARLWQETCARCHNYRRPGSRTDSQWRVIIHHMRVRANIPGSDAREILRFLQAAN